MASDQFHQMDSYSESAEYINYLFRRRYLHLCFRNCRRFPILIVKDLLFINFELQCFKKVMTEIKPSASLMPEICQYEPPGSDKT